MRTIPRDFRRTAVAEPPASTEGQRLCAREGWCTGYRLVQQADGTSKREPGLTYTTFCVADTAVIAGHLSPVRGLPAAYWWLQAEIGNPARRGEMIRVPFGPKMLLSEYYDLLMRRITEVLCSYEERVRDAARLTALDTQESALGSHKTVGGAAKTLHAHLSALLALPAEEMFRHVPSGELRASTDARSAGAPVLGLWQNAVVFGNRDGTATLMVPLNGAAAGTEILDLHRRCLVALGQVGTIPELLDGVPCRVCGTMGLVRAEPPSDPKAEADWSRCPDMSCGDRMRLGTYRQWCARYEAWAKSLGSLTCHRCEIGRCEHCIYAGCECAAEGHPQAA